MKWSSRPSRLGTPHKLRVKLGQLDDGKGDGGIL